MTSTPKYTIALIPPERVREAWPKAKPHLKAAIDLSHGRWRPEYVLASLVLNEQQLWVVFDAEGGINGAITTQKVFYPEKTVLTVHFLGGDDFDSWFGYLSDTLTRFARDTDCDYVECIARPGFWKWFKKDGFEKLSVFYEKEITKIDERTS